MELSIEEKAKAYDEAIERAKDFMNGEVHYALKKGENIMCWVFPQLRESDDERIRKALMQNLKERFGTKGNMGEGLDMPDVLAWFEKQGEQKPCMIQWKGDNLKEVIDFTGKDKNFEKWFKSFEEYEKYVDDHNGIFKLFNTDGTHYEIPVGSWIVKTPDGCNVASKAKYKQKTAWSEEDKSIVTELIGIFESAVDGGYVDIPYRLLKDYIRVLKSCLPQTTWKPSDEMLEALYRVIPENVMEKSEDDMLLDKLYQGLKYGKVLSEK